MKGLLFIFIYMSLLSGCKQEASLPNGSYYGDELKVHLETPVQISSKHAGSKAAVPVTLTVASIDDSRCPTGVTCMWAGKADVVVNLTRQDGESVNINLCLGQCSNASYKEADMKVISLDGAKYKVSLLQVVPYPTNENAEQQKTAVLKVEEEV